MSQLFWVLVGIIAIQRVGELALNRRNERRLMDQGAHRVEADGYRALVAVHVLWFAAMIVEAIVSPWAGLWVGTWPLLAVYALAEALRLWTMVTLGERWTTRVIVIPGADRIEEGPFRWLDHPIYVAVSLELAALPLAFGLPVTAGLVSIANGLALHRRIRIEETALTRAKQA